jgi:hypothetical protein
MDEIRRLLRNKSIAARLVLLLKFFGLQVRFPRYIRDVPKAAVRYGTAQLDGQGPRSPADCQPQM